MITRDNFTGIMNELSFDDKEKIKNSLHDYEYAKVQTSSYGNIWLDEVTNDLPHDYSEQVSDGTTYFLSIEELVNILD